MWDLSFARSLPQRGYRAKPKVGARSAPPAYFGTSRPPNTARCVLQTRTPLGSREKRNDCRSRRMTEQRPGEPKFAGPSCPWISRSLRLRRNFGRRFRSRRGRSLCRRLRRRICGSNLRRSFGGSFRRRISGLQIPGRRRGRLGRLRLRFRRHGRFRTIRSGFPRAFGPCRRIQRGNDGRR